MTAKSNVSISSASATDRKFIGLRRFNAIMGFLHLVQGIFMIVVSRATTYPIFTNYLSFDVATRSLKPNTQLFYELPLGSASRSYDAAHAALSWTWRPPTARRRASAAAQRGAKKVQYRMILDFT